MTTFVLVHGAWHDGGAWAPVVRHLESKGHKAFAPTIAGNGRDADRNVGLAEAQQSIIDYIAGQAIDDFVLLGHSYGGMIIAKVAEAMPDKVRRLVFWNAFVPEDGKSLLDDVPPHYVELFDQLAAASADNTVMLPYPIWRDAFINDADAELAQSAYETLAPHPYRTNSDKAELKTFAGLEIPKSYLNATEDIALPPGEWGWHPRMSSRLGLYRLVQMPGSHEIIFTNPTGLAEKIIEAGRD